MEPVSIFPPSTVPAVRTASSSCEIACVPGTSIRSAIPSARARAAARTAAATAPATEAATAADVASTVKTAAKIAIDPRLIACLAAVYLIWSSTYLAMRIVVEEIPPLAMASLRFTAAGLALLVIAKQRGSAWPTWRQWLGALPVGALLFLGGNGFVGMAEQS